MTREMQFQQWRLIQATIQLTQKQNGTDLFAKETKLELDFFLFKTASVIL